MYKTNNVIVTISREAGSCGRKIGKLLAEKLGWKVYDKEILELTAQEANCSPEGVAAVEHAHSSMFGMSIDRVGVDFDHSVPLNDKLFEVEARLIQNIADQGNAVIVGRCAEAALEEYAPTIRVFIQGSLEKRLKYIMDRDKSSREEAIKRLKLVDKTRATYHNYYTDTKWGERENYDLVINSDIGVEASAELIASYVKALLPLKSE